MAVSSSELAGPEAVSLSHRPQALVLPFLGALVLDRPGARVRSTVFLRLLGDLGVAEPAARGTLRRMRERGLLDQHRSGREVTWSITEFGSALLTRNRERVESDDPFARTDGTWTLLSYSMPETRRDLRHQMRATLGWAGFGGLRDGLWIAPGTVDVEHVLRDAGLDELGELADWFSATPLPGTDVPDVIRRAWDLEAVAAVHEAFLDRWLEPPTDLDILPRYTLLGADWLQVLRKDPGLPVAHLPTGWPAPESARLHAQLLRDWREQAVAELDRQLVDA
jgi:DNA-binding transcriptional regulator PaaX